MRALSAALLATCSFSSGANATAADYTKYYYYDYEFYSAQFNVFVDTMYSWPKNGTVSFYEQRDPAPLQSWPTFHFGFFLVSLDVEEVVSAPLTFSSGHGIMPESQRGMDGIYFFGLSSETFRGSLAFDHALDIISWDVVGWEEYASTSHYASSSPQPLEEFWDRLLNADGWNFPTGTDLPPSYFSSSYWEPMELSFSTSIGRWEKRMTIICYSEVLADSIDCPEEPSRPAPVPLPASLPLLAGALFLLGGARRLRR